MSILLGVNLYNASGDAAQRQAHCVDSLLRLKSVDLANLQFYDAQYERNGLPTCPVLRQDSRTITGREGVRKPVMSEMFDVLAEQAITRSCRWFGFINSDIMVSQEAVDLVTSSCRQCYVFSRMDVDAADGRDLRMIICGVDMFVLEAEWWVANRPRFRPYVTGESCWDNVYAAVVLCHSEGWLLNRRPLIRHEAHPKTWSAGPFAEYNGFLAALDRPYFTLWCEYVAALEVLRASGADEREEIELRERVFVWRPSRVARLLHTARAAKARLLNAVGHWIRLETR